MKHFDYKRLLQYLPLVLLLAFVCIGGIALGDVGNQNRYSSGGGGDFSGGGDGDGALGFLIGLCVDLLFRKPVVGIPLLIILVVVYIVLRKKKKKNGGSTTLSSTATSYNPPQHFTTPALPAELSQAIAQQIQAIDPAFSADKFTAWAREVFLKLQQAWTARDWKVIRPFESEELFSQHNSQLEEYIRNNKINVVEKIGIKSCGLKSFTVDGDKEVLTVQLGAVMRDYVIDATTKQVLESDPNKDWYMTYELVFNRKTGVKTKEGLSNKSTTNCPNCGAPTQITSAGQCEYCGSVITTGEHDWVLSDIHSI